MDGHNKSWSARDIVLADDLNKKFAFNINFGGAADSADIQAITYDETNNHLYGLRNSGGALGVRKLQPIGSNNAINLSGSSLTLWASFGNYNSASNTIAETTDYIYCWVRLTADSTWYLIRITKSDKSFVNMTFSGTAPDNDGGNLLCAYNGDIYIADVNSTTIRKYTISGTTATYDSAITTSATINNDSTFITNGSYWWYENGIRMLYKDDFTGSNITSQRQTKDLLGNGFVFAGVVYGVEFDNHIDETILVAIDII